MVNEGRNIRRKMVAMQ